MFLVTDNAKIVCPHSGKVSLKASQSWVRVEGAKVLVEKDLEGRSIGGCMWTGGSLVPCTKTLRVLIGQSPLIRIDGRRVYRDTVRGLTSGAPPPGTFQFKVARTWQQFVEELG